jgi:hypothetical protein
MIDVVVLNAATSPATVTFRFVIDEAQEDTSVPVSSGTADQFMWALAETPFKTTKPGTYSVHVVGVTETKGSLEKTAELEIRKGASRAQRSFPIERPLFFLLWNVFNLRRPPSKFGADERKS